MAGFLKKEKKKNKRKNNEESQKSSLFDSNYISACLIISSLEVRESRSLYVYIYILM